MIYKSDRFFFIGFGQMGPQNREEQGFFGFKIRKIMDAIWVESDISLCCYFGLIPLIDDFPAFEILNFEGMV